MKKTFDNKRAKGEVYFFLQECKEENIKRNIKQSEIIHDVNQTLQTMLNSLDDSDKNLLYQYRNFGS